MTTLENRPNTALLVIDVPTVPRPAAPTCASAPPTR